MSEEPTPTAGVNAWDHDGKGVVVSFMDKPGGFWSWRVISYELAEQLRDQLHLLTRETASRQGS